MRQMNPVICLKLFKFRMTAIFPIKLIGIVIHTVECDRNAAVVKFDFKIWYRKRIF